MKYWYNNQWNELTLNALDGMPIGSIIQFAGSVIPTGWLICDGSSLSEEEYPQLYDVIGHTYGGNGLSFNLPNFKGKVSVGRDTSDTDFDTLGETGGSKELQKHNHELRENDATASNFKGLVTSAYSGSTGWVVSNSATIGNGSDLIGHHTKDTGTGDSGNLQPYLVVNYIIKATQTTPTFATVVNATNSSTTDSYSCNYSNEHYGGVVLYNNASGTTSNITLNDDISNYSKVEIVTKHWYFNAYKTYVIQNPSQGPQDIGMSHINNGTLYVTDTTLTFSGTSVTFGNSYSTNTGSWPSGVGTIGNDSATRPKIYKIVGYK